MNDTGALISINNREALPVRAIPYYSAWRLPPDLLANEFSLGAIELCSWLRHTPTYHIVNDTPIKILASEWDNSDLSLKSLTVRFKFEFENIDQGSEAWRTNSITKLPAGAFVWLDEFLNSYRENSVESSDLTASTNTQELQFITHPIILKDSLISKLVFEGFESYSSATTNNVDASLSTLSTTPARPARPIPAQRFQEQEILRVIKELGYEAVALPKPTTQGVFGVKAEVRAKLDLQNGVFNKAWERLRAGKDIRDK